MAFNPQEFITKIKGKDYLEVKWRLVWFRDENPVSNFENSLRLKTVIVEDTGEQANVRAELYSPTGELLATAHKREHKKEFHDYMEKAETGAIGRVLAMAGYGTQFAEELELPEGKVVDAPIEQRGSKTANRNTPTSSDDEKEKRRQEAIARAQAKANGDSTPPNSKTSDSKEETPNVSAEPITDGQKKAVENLVKIISRKKEIDLPTVVSENFSKDHIDDLTNTEGVELIKVLNGLMKG